MEFIPFVAALAFAWKLVDFIKYLSNKDTNGAITQLAVWGSGVIAVFLLASTDFAAGISVGDLPVSSLNWASLVLVGLSVGSSGSVAFDFKKALDREDSAKTESLLP